MDGDGTDAGTLRVRPIAAKLLATGEALSLNAIPMEYRNDDESNRLIALGQLKSPWPRVGLTAPLDDLIVLDAMVSGLMMEFWISRAEAVARVTCHYRDKDLSDIGTYFLNTPNDVWRAEIYLEQVQVGGTLVTRPKDPPAKDSGCWPK